MKFSDAVILLIAVIAALTFYNQLQIGTLTTQVADSSGAKVIEKVGEVKLDFYVMSQCPYGTQVEDGIKPVLDKLGDNIDFNLNFIADDLGNGQFNSLHGQPEVLGDIVQLCAVKYNPKKYMDMIVCQNEDARAIPGNWESCAKENNLDVEKIKACYEGNEGKELLSESIKKSNAVNAQGSPTMFMNGQPYGGGRAADDFMRAICQELDHKADACKTLPKPVEVELIVLNDGSCAECDASRIITVSKNLFPGLKQKNVDIKSDEGKKLITELGIEIIPAFIFDEKITETNSWSTNAQIQAAFEKKGSVYKIKDEASGAAHFVSEEKRLAQERALAQAKLMAEKSLNLVKNDNKPQIDFFVMSYCPFGNQAEEIVEQVYQVLGDKAIFNPHYVIYSNYQGGGPNYCLDEDSKYCSMHGIQELNQGIRELCVNNYIGIKQYFEFVLAMNKECSSANADSCWEPVAKKLGLDVEKIKTCEKEEGLALSAKELELNQLLGVSGSPTIFVEGESYEGARTAAGFQSALCSGFETQPEECSNIIPTTAATAAAPTGGCG